MTGPTDRGHTARPTGKGVASMASAKGSWRASLLGGPLGPPVPRRELVKLLERLRTTMNVTIDKLIALVEAGGTRKRRRARRTAR